MAQPSLSAARAELARGQLTSARLVETALERIADEDGEGSRAFIEVYAGDARQEAGRADTILAAGGGRSFPLLGLPISVKDLFDIEARPTTAGSIILKDAPPAAADANIIRRLRHAGAIIVGRTNMTEFAFSGLGLNPHYGTPRNPYDRETGRIPGGSSSGAAVSVSDNMCLGAIGSDTGGSVRIPAALCGLAGFKPTQRRVPLQGAFPLSPTLDSIGPIARTIDDCILLDRVLSGEHAEVPQVALRDLRFAVPRTYVLDDVDEAVASAFFRALERLSAAGAAITELAIPALAEFPAINQRGTFPGIEGCAIHREMLERDADRYDPRVRVRLAAGGRYGLRALNELRRDRARITQAVGGATGSYDAFVMPTVPNIAPPIADLDDDRAYARSNLLMLRNPTIVNFIDGCAATVPCHEPGSASVGLTIAGLHGTDKRILSIARTVQATLIPN